MLSRRAGRGCGRSRRRRLPASCADWQDCVRGSPIVAAASGRRRNRSRAPRLSDSARAPTRKARAASWRTRPTDRCRPAAAAGAQVRTSRLRSRAARPRTRRGSIRFSALSATRVKCSAARRAGRLHERSRIWFQASSHLPDDVSRARLWLSPAPAVAVARLPRSDLQPARRPPG